MLANVSQQATHTIAGNYRVVVSRQCVVTTEVKVYSFQPIHFFMNVSYIYLFKARHTSHCVMNRIMYVEYSGNKKLLYSPIGLATL